MLLNRKSEDFLELATGYHLRLSCWCWAGQSGFKPRVRQRDL